MFRCAPIVEIVSDQSERQLSLGQMLRMQDLVDENDSSDANDTQAEESSPEAQQPFFSPLADRASVAPAQVKPASSDLNVLPLEDQEGGPQRQTRRRRTATAAAAGERKRKPVAEHDPYSQNADECLEDFSNNETSTGTLSQTESSSSQLPRSAAVSEQSYRSSSGAQDHADVRRRQQLKEASKRCRKRQKDESMVFSTEINTLHQKLALLYTKFDTPGLPSTEENRSAGHHRFRMKRLIAFLEKKLSDHKRWLRSVRGLMVSAPLFDFAANLAKDGSDLHSVIPDLKYLDEWREVCEHEKFSRVLMTQRIEDAVRSSSKSASDLLTEFANRREQFQRRHVSRGWSIGTTSNNSLLAFHCERQFPIGTSAKDIAFKLWHSVQRDDILRTFVPMVQESTITHESESCSITRRLLQRNPNAQHQPVVTVESIAVAEENSLGQTNEEAWQISIEVIDDHYLCLLAAAKADEAPQQSPHAHASSANTQPADDGSSNNDSSKAAGRFTVASRILQTVSGASVELAGCTQHEESLSDDSASLELLQYFVMMLPVYEELHLFQSSTL